MFVYIYEVLLELILFDIDISHDKLSKTEIITLFDVLLKKHSLFFRHINKELAVPKDKEIFLFVSGWIKQGTEWNTTDREKRLSEKEVVREMKMFEWVRERNNYVHSVSSIYINKDWQNVIILS